MDVLKKCEICGYGGLDPSKVYPEGDEDYKYYCEVCGNVDINRVAISTIISDPTKLKCILSGYNREMTEKSIPFKIRFQDGGELEEYLTKINYPRTLTEKMDKLLDYLEMKSDSFGANVRINSNTDYSIVYGKNPSEFIFIIGQLVNSNMIIARENNTSLQLVYNGWKYIEENRSKNLDSRQAFVATWFSDEMDAAYSSIKRAIRDAGYESVWMKYVPHNGEIDYRIFAEIRKSKFVVCDFTGQRNSVYYEAGFAFGLNIPVIWMCRKDNLESLAFDTRQFNHIVWENEDDIYDILKARIEATIL